MKWKFMNLASTYGGEEFAKMWLGQSWAYGAGFVCDIVVKENLESHLGL